MDKRQLLAWRRDQDDDLTQIPKSTKFPLRRRRSAIQHRVAGELKQMRAEGFGPAYVKKQIQHKTAMIFGLYGLEDYPVRIVEGRILRGYTYILDLLLANDRFRVEKINLMYIYKVADQVEIAPNISCDQSIQKLSLGPARRKEERYEIDEEMLIRCFKEKRMMTLVIRTGESFTGYIDWFSNYEIKIRLDVVRKAVVIFRHALYRASVT